MPREEPLRLAAHVGGISVNDTIKDAIELCKRMNDEFAATHGLESVNFRPDIKFTGSVSSQLAQQCEFQTSRRTFLENLAKEHEAAARDCQEKTARLALIEAQLQIQKDALEQDELEDDM